MTQNILRLASVLAPMTVFAFAAVGQSASCSHQSAENPEIFIGEIANLFQPEFERSHHIPDHSHQSADRTALDETPSHSVASATAVCALDLSQFDDDTQDAGNIGSEDHSEQIAKRINSFMSQRF